MAIERKEEAGRGRHHAAVHAPVRTQSVRVNISRLDSLMNLVGELVINRTRLTEIASSYNIAELKETWPKPPASPPTCRTK